MDPSVTVDSLHGLSQDLTQLLKNGSPPNIEQLAVELETHLPAYSRLLDKQPRNAASRRTLNEGGFPSRYEPGIG